MYIHNNKGLRLGLDSYDMKRNMHLAREPEGMMI